MGRTGKVDYLKLAAHKFDRIELKLRTCEGGRRFDLILLDVGRIALDEKALTMYDCTIYSGNCEQGGYRLKFTKSKSIDYVKLYYNRRVMKEKCMVVDILLDADSSINLF